MRRAHAPHLIVTAALALCACNAKPPSVSSLNEPPPAWRTEEGRKKTWREMARWYIDNNLPGEAMDMVKRLRDSGEDSADLTLIQARSLLAQGVPDEARGLLEDLIASRPKHPAAYQVLGVVQADLGEADAAIATLSRAVELDDSDVPTRNNLGFLLLARDRCDEAVEHLSAVLDADGTNGRYRNNLAFALACTGDVERAYKLFRSSLPEADAHYNMGVAFERLENWSDAVIQYEQALTSDPNHEAAHEALARLETSPSPSTDGVE